MDEGAFKSSTVFDCGILKLPKINSESGNITPIQENQNVPFSIERVYYLYDIPGGETRGGHAHFELRQLIVAVSGSFDVLLNDGINQKVITLNRPYYGLLIVPGIWRELLNFSSGAICLVLASNLYDEEDYIRTFKKFKEHKGNDY